MSHVFARGCSVFAVFLRLGLSSFGGPVAHIAYFREEFVVRRAWLPEAVFSELLALCQFLPGPASSQLGIAIGFSRARYVGALMAWLGFTLPSALLMLLAAYGLSFAALPASVLHGLKIVAFAVVAQAVWAMGGSLCKGLGRQTIMVLVASAALIMPSVWIQIVVILCAATLGALAFKSSVAPSAELPLLANRCVGLTLLLVFAVLLLGLPYLAEAFPLFKPVDVFYRAGALVFGGGHVVLPLLQAQFVPSGWLDKDTFLAGYGLAQALPGPLFTFSAFLGAAMQGGQGGWLGGVVATLAIFLPGALLVLGALPFWASLQKMSRARAALAGVNAAVVGLLLAALYQPVWVSAIFRPWDFACALLALLALIVWKCPPWALVLIFAGLGYVGLL